MVTLEKERKIHIYINKYFKQIFFFIYIFINLILLSLAIIHIYQIFNIKYTITDIIYLIQVWSTV